MKPGSFCFVFVFLMFQVSVFQTTAYNPLDYAFNSYLLNACYVSGTVSALGTHRVKANSSVGKDKEETK